MKAAAILTVLLCTNIGVTMSSDINHDVLLKPAVRAIPGGAYLTYAGKMGGNITPAQIAKHKSLVISGCASGSSITQFVLKVRKGDDNRVFKSGSGELSSEMLAALKKLNSGDSFEFIDMKAKLPGGGTVDVHCREFKVV